jgi:hypothetical protein
MIAALVLNFHTSKQAYKNTSRNNHLQYFGLTKQVMS